MQILKYRNNFLNSSNICRDGKELKTTMNTKLIQEDKTCILKTSKFSKDDIGTYKCVATNSAGTAECEAKVEGKLCCKDIWKIRQKLY